MLPNRMIVVICGPYDRFSSYSGDFNSFIVPLFICTYVRLFRLTIQNSEHQSRFVVHFFSPILSLLDVVRGRRRKEHRIGFHTAQPKRRHLRIFWVVMGIEAIEKIQTTRCQWNAVKMVIRINGKSMEGEGKKIWTKGEWTYLP